VHQVPLVLRPSEERTWLRSTKRDFFFLVGRPHLPLLEFFLGACLVTFYPCLLSRDRGVFDGSCLVLVKRVSTRFILDCPAWLDSLEIYDRS
jgi:hypothetical protein